MEEEKTEGSGTSFHRGRGKIRSFNLEDSRRVQASTRHYCDCPKEFSASWKCANRQTFWKTTKDIAKSNLFNHALFIDMIVPAKFIIDN